jgi:hypothetical protein
MASSTLRQDQATCALTVEGRELPFVFNKRGGGEFDSEESKTRPAGGRRQVAHGGAPTVENVTLTAEFVPARDHADIQFLKKVRGWAEAGVVENYLDANGSVLAVGDTWTGVVKRVNTGSYDANSSDPREFEIEISTHGD